MVGSLCQWVRGLFSVSDEEGELILLNPRSFYYFLFQSSADAWLDTVSDEMELKVLPACEKFQTGGAVRVKGFVEGIPWKNEGKLRFHRRLH